MEVLLTFHMNFFLGDKNIFILLKIKNLTSSQNAYKKIDYQLGEGFKSLFKY